MKTTLIFKIILGILLMVIISSCKKPSTEIIQDPQLLKSLYTNSVDTLVYDNHKYFLETFVWRDFMPSFPSNGMPPLIASINLVNFDSVPVSNNLEIDKLYIIDSNLIWISSPTEITTENVPEFKIHKVSHNGPHWETGTQVDVVVTIYDKVTKQDYYLIIKQQFIRRTE
jgi:hypothetical protein